MTINFIKHTKKKQLNKELLPSPSDYYDLQGIKLTGKGEWRSALCPFHEDRFPSLRINMQSGGFICMACNARGGDIIAFHQKRFNSSFKVACAELGGQAK
jgi:DNA primase